MSNKLIRKFSEMKLIDKALTVFVIVSALMFLITTIVRYL